MTDETLKITLGNLRDDIDMLLNAHYSTSENGIAGMKERIASMISNIDTLTTGLADTNTKLAQDEITLNNCVQHNAMYDQMIAPLVEQNRSNISDLTGNFSTFLDDFLKLQEKQDTIEIGEKIALWSPYLMKLRSILDILDADDAQSLKNLLENGSSGDNTELQEKITELENKINALIQNNVDPDYNPKDYVEESAQTIKQSYAKYFRKFISNCYSSNFTTIKAHFAAQTTCSGTVKIKFIFKISGNMTPTVTIYNGENIIKTESVTFAKDTTLIYETTIEDVVLSTTNEIYLKISNAYSVVYNCESLQVEIVAPNVEVVDQFSPYNVECYNGKYYITDCTGKTAKIAIINAEDMISIENLVWTDTGIEANFYKVAFGTTIADNKIVPGLRVDQYHKDQKYYFREEGQTTDYTSVAYYSGDWLPQQNEKPMFYAIDRGYLGATAITFDNHKTNGGSQIQGDFVYVSGAKNGEKYTLSINNYYGMANTFSGTCKFLADYAYSRNSYALGFGINGRTYLKNMSSYNCEATCYYKYFNKMIKKEITFNPNNGVTVTSTQEIGPYEEYFEGLNNDYFAVKHGKLRYFKKPT